jgi:hypothetical protein
MGIIANIYRISNYPDCSNDGISNNLDAARKAAICLGVRISDAQIQDSVKKYLKY